MQIKIDRNIHIDTDCIQYSHIRASGPGGQNVNKVSSAVQLRFFSAKAGLKPDVLQRLLRLAGTRVNSEDEIIITARQFRSQDKNRKEALVRLIALIRKALIVPVKRKETKPSKAAHKRRLETKKRLSEKKAGRRRLFGE